MLRASYKLIKLSFAKMILHTTIIKYYMKKVVSIILPVAALICLFFQARQNNDLINFISFQFLVLFLLVTLLASIDKRIFLSKPSAFITLILLIISFILYVIFKLDILITTSLLFGFLLLIQLVKITSSDKLKQKARNRQKSYKRNFNLK